VGEKRGGNFPSKGKGCVERPENGLPCSEKLLQHEESGRQGRGSVSLLGGAGTRIIKKVSPD